jgi:ABC-type uncharacterized transport system ATPase subunit
VDRSVKIDVPRLRMFAGPNGSGKTTIKTGLGKSTEWFGLYFNADEIEADIRTTGRHTLQALGFDFTESDLRDYFANSAFQFTAIIQAYSNAKGERHGVSVTWDSCIVFSDSTRNTFTSSVMS